MMPVIMTRNWTFRVNHVLRDMSAAVASEHE